MIVEVIPKVISDGRTQYGLYHDGKWVKWLGKAELAKYGYARAEDGPARTEDGPAFMDQLAQTLDAQGVDWRNGE